MVFHDILLLNTTGNSTDPTTDPTFLAELSAIEFITMFSLLLIIVMFVFIGWFALGHLYEHCSMTSTPYRTTIVPSRMMWRQATLLIELDPEKFAGLARTEERPFDDLERRQETPPPPFRSEETNIDSSEPSVPTSQVATSPAHPMANNGQGPRVWGCWRQIPLPPPFTSRARHAHTSEEANDGCSNPSVSTSQGAALPIHSAAIEGQAPQVLNQSGRLPPTSR
ncbi:hypothetical protein K432DRAFT_405070 [Lepidopterella palustris CBS 459.81]|uniref:Uncharacterized protein n=1 Tax=Lepidopterella palustris CBS 459.81 TaxID=1314670 RepID=A0A8E2JEY5_9PEZI|nr:hypothetical protein K432DRAFT_405070 [Lepidopterella palustris CBS 459.81]